MGKSRLIHIPFTEGQREDIDPKLLPSGFLTRAKNVRLRKDGRWGVRYGDTALALTTNQTSDLRASDLVSFDDRLFAIADANLIFSTPSTDLYEFVEHDQFAWRSTDPDTFNIRLGLVTGVRDIGRPPSQDVNVSILDCAAYNGLVCLVYETNSASLVHIFRADTDATLLFSELSVTRPRVVVADGKFFVGGVNGTTVELYSYDPTTDEVLQEETDMFSSGASINAWDMAANVDGDGFWAVVHRSTPTTTIGEFDGDGASVQTITGPAVALTHVTICQTATRIHLGVIKTADTEVYLYSYTLAGVQDPASETNVLNSATSTVQVGMVDQQTSTGAEIVAIYAECAGSPGKDILYEGYDTEHSLQFQHEWPESSLGTKPQVDPGSENFIHVFGGTQNEGLDPSGTQLNGNFLGLMRPQYIGTYKDRFTAGTTNDVQLPQIARDSVTGKYYWPNLVVDVDFRQTPRVTEFLFCDNSRRQTVDMGGLLYIFGGMPQVFDTRQIVGAGYQETPVITDIAASNGAGSLPSSTTLNVATVWEWYDSRGFLHQSPLSEVKTVTMGASDDTITFKQSVPHDLRCNETAGALNGSVKAVAYRSLSGKKQLRRADTEDVTTFGDDVAFTLTAGDTDIATGAVIYTQGGRGALGDVLEHESPLPATYACRLGKRILSAGGPDPYVAQVSKPEFPGEPINWSGDAAFLLKCPDRIRGVAAQDLIGYLFSRSAVYVFTGEGPDDTGQGTFSDPTELPSSVGLHDANSIVTTPIGVMYQADEEKLMLIPRGGGTPEWFGQPVRDTLKAFPVVTAATVCPQEQLVTFSCNNAGGTDGRLIHYDLRAKTWLVDEFDGSTPITAITEHEGRLVRLSEGVITRANTTHPAAAFIEHSLVTGTIRPFGDNAWGKLVNITFLGEFRGNCTLTCLISYDDGENWTTLTAFELSTANGLTAGDTIRRQWWPSRRKGDRFMLEFRVTALAGAASEGLVFNECTLGVMGSAGETRFGAGKRG